ncbi:hypothetical protein [Acinetobacter indicus]|uniref:Uncharacterized protein n=1 Tax=Acinetobacter indicus TaxID=756892 RepID=A0AAW8Z160_9GAMM|nr:hypothetical protein [Acinetobacter indicus]MDV4311943.1 hypothetical protein [Acinetobacter indicus]MDV4314680.1 hypothetical protein [Acinetobacter indicus]
MKKTLTTIFMSSALLATSSLYAAPALQANVNASAAVQTPQAGGLLNNVNASAAVQTPQAGGLLNNVVQGTQQTLHSGEHVGQGLHSVKTTTQNTWQNTKQFSNEKAEAGKEKAADLKQAVYERSSELKQSAAEKAAAAREHAADRTEKTKNSLKQKSAQAQLHSNAQVDVDTPVAKAKVSSKTHTAVGAAQ